MWTGEAIYSRAAWEAGLDQRASLEGVAAIEFRLRTESLGIGEVTTVTPYVGGTSLIELARRAEARAAKADGQPDLAGSYAGLVVGDRRWQDWYSGAGPQVWFGDGDSCCSAARAATPAAGR